MATTTSSSPSSRSKSPTPSSASSSISSVSSLSNTDVDVEVDPIVVAPLETTTDNTSINSSINSDHLVDDNFGDNDSKLVQSTTIVESSQQQPTKFAPIIQIPLKFPKLQSLQNAKLFFRIMDLVFEQHRITDELQMFTLTVTRMSECEVLPLVQDMIYDIPLGEPYQKLKSLVIDHCNIHLMTHHLHCNDDDNEDDVDDNSTPGSLLNSVSTGVGVGAGAASTTTDVDSDDDNESLDFDTAENSCVFQDSEEIHISG